MSFENSVCRDYITEKMYDRIGNLLPVVLRRSTYKGIIPDEAFIAADDFNRPKDLANYLNYLSSNYTAFSKLVFFSNAVRVLTDYQLLELNNPL